MPISRVSLTLICGVALAVVVFTLATRKSPGPIVDGDGSSLQLNNKPEVSLSKGRITLTERPRRKPVKRFSREPENLAAGRISEPYHYPTLPGRKEWIERLQNATPWSLCQIPEHILTNLTDAALLDTCLRYPMRGDVSLFDSFEKGLAVTIQRFNGLRELLLRDGTAPLLKEHFLSMTVDQIGVAQISNENIGFLDLNFVCTLLLHPDVFSKLTAIDRTELCEGALELQTEIRHRYGSSAGELPAAALAATLLASGTRISTSIGSLDRSKLFNTDGPHPALNVPTLDSLQAIGQELLKSDARQ